MKIQTMTILLVGIGLLTLTATLVQSADQPAEPDPGGQKKCCAQEGAQAKCGDQGCCLGKGGHGKGGQGKGGQGQRDHGKPFRGGKGQGHDARHAEDRELFHFLLNHHEEISRQVIELPDGVETLTESEVPEIASKIKEHVQWMQHRVENAMPIRRRDPLFEEIFKHTDQIEMEREETDNGVRVVETSKDPYVAKLIKEHAKAVSGFVSRGFAEARLNHAVPAKDADQAAKRVRANVN